MHLSTNGYYSDFIVYPLLIVGLTVIGFVDPGTGGAIRWAMIYLGCIALWTLIEYCLHRFFFHHAPIMKDLHGEHHDEERALVGTPIWLSLLAHGVFVFLPVVAIFDVATATAASAGIMSGYLWYVSIHHILHHGRISHDSYLYALKRHHALHHHRSESCNFGVTSCFWDRVFRTYMTTPQRSSFEGVRLSAGGIMLDNNDAKTAED